MQLIHIHSDKPRNKNKKIIYVYKTELLTKF